MNKSIYKRDRPNLLVEQAGGAQLGNCYMSAVYRVTSTQQMTGNMLRALRDAGAICHGQEFYYHQLGPEGEKIAVTETASYGDGRPTGIDVVPCVDVDDHGNVVGIALNYQNNPITPAKLPYYVYICESRVDSGD